MMDSCKEIIPRLTTPMPNPDYLVSCHLSLDGLDFVKTVRPLFYAAYETAKQKL